MLYFACHCRGLGVIGLIGISGFSFPLRKATAVQLERDKNRKAMEVDIGQKIREKTMNRKVRRASTAGSRLLNYLG